MMCPAEEQAKQPPNIVVIEPCEGFIEQKEIARGVKEMDGQDHAPLFSIGEHGVLGRPDLMIDLILHAHVLQKISNSLP